MIESAMEKGHLVSFDLVGAAFEDKALGKPLIRPRGPEMRSNRLNFFKEITSEEMMSYKPEQIATILEQRDHLHKILDQEHQFSDYMKRAYNLSGASVVTGPPPGLGFEPRENKKPWVPDDEDECQFKCCHQCRPTSESRGYLSLDGILKGDIPTTAAIGFGFHLMGSRPVMDANVIKTIGYRAVPLPRSVVSDSLESPSSPSSIWSILDMIDEQMVELVHLESDSDSTETSPGLTDGSTSGDESQKGKEPIVQDGDNGHIKSSAIRPPWTPPVTPTTWDGAQKGEHGIVNFESHPKVGDGRSPDSLKTNPRLRRAAFDSIRQYVAASAQGSPQALPTPYFPYEPADANDVGLFLPFNKAVFARACLTPLPPPSPQEENLLNEVLTQMMEKETEEGRFHEEPLEVEDGVAVMEESVGLGLPDVVSQV